MKKSKIFGYNPYSEKQSIEYYLESYEEFFDLLDIRRKMVKEKREIGNFYIFNGKYWIDEFGQISKVIAGLDELKKYFDIPLVLTNDEFHEIMGKYNEKFNCITNKEIKNLEWEEITKLRESGRPFGITISTSMQPNLPGRNTICPYCGKGWDLSNIDDCLHHQSTWKDYPIKVMDLYGDIIYNYVGHPLKHMWDHIQLRSNALYYPMCDHGITNPKWIDNNPDPKYSTLKINENGFYKGKIDENYILQEGDEVGFQVVECFHKTCNRNFLNDKETEKFTDCFTKAGYENNFKLSPIPNEYCNDINNCSRCGCWFNVTTKFGIIKIGWRERVILIDWSNTFEKDKVNGKFLFQDEDVTTGTNYIHAWGYEKCVEYLEKLRKEFEKL